MMKLSALLTWIVVVAFAMGTTSAIPECNITLADNSGCDADDVVEIVRLLNMKSKGKRVLNENDQEESPTGLRRAQVVDCVSCANKICGGFTGCIQCKDYCKRRRNLQSTAAAKAAMFGQLIQNTLGTFRWNECDPSNLKSVTCADV